MKRNFYLSTSGRDADSGTIESPWRTLAHAAKSGLRRGDTLILGAGSYSGPFQISDLDGPADELFTVVGAGGDTLIDAANGVGLEFLDSTGIVVKSLKIQGSGPTKNNSAGIRARSPNASGALSISHVDVSGFGHYGILVESSESKKGYHGVEISHAHVHQIGVAGIEVSGKFTSDGQDYAHENVDIIDCHVHDVTGVPGLDTHSGNGIVIWDIRGGKISRCRAHDNGVMNTTPRCGPIGIWAWDCQNVVIEDCESFRNRTASVTDGGGFGLDGGAQGCALRRNRSYENDGAGYTLSQFDGARPFLDNVVEDNFSENDARRNNYGALHLWCAHPSGILRVKIRNNVIRIGKAVYGDSRGVRFQGCTEGVEISNNEFSSKGLCYIADVEPGQMSLVLRENRYLSEQNKFLVSWLSRRYEDLANWLKDSSQS